MAEVTITDDKGNVVKVDTEKGTAEKVPEKSFLDDMIDSVSGVAKGVAGEGVFWNDPNKK